MLMYLVPALVLAALLMIAGYLVAGLFGVLVAASAALVFVKRSMGWIAMLMMHMGPGDNAEDNNNFYEGPRARAFLLAAIALPAVVLFLTSTYNSAPAALAVWCIGIASTVTVVVRPFNRGCAVQAAGLGAAVICAIVARVLRENGQTGVLQLTLWLMSGAGAGLLARRPVGDDAQTTG